MGIYKGCIKGYIGFYRDNGKENGNYYLGFRVQGCRSLINNLPPLKGLNIRIPFMISMRGRGFID